MSCPTKYYCRAYRYLQSRSSYTQSLNREITNEATETERRARALSVLEIISSKSDGASNHQNHFGIVQEFLQRDSRQFKGQTISEYFDRSKTNNGISSVLKEVLLEDSSISINGDMQKRDGWTFDAYGLSSAVSFCGSNRDLRTGSGFHGLAMKGGFISDLYVGSSLVILYRDSNNMDNAHKVFEEMPAKNVVLWTNIISGFAQEWRVDICLKLYSKMRNSTSDPNNYTFTALLSACTGSGALGHGRSVHCQTLQMGFKSYLHVSNALISMYCKCGDLKDAYRIFDRFLNKDVVSWNSMIAGYAQHGLAAQAIELFEVMMPKSGTKPDAVTYLGVLSSCRHAGLVKEGRKFFNLMKVHGLKPELNHYSCLVDLLCFPIISSALLLVLFFSSFSIRITLAGLSSRLSLHG